MGNEVDRRAQFAARIPFDANVEVGGALGPSFDARAINLSSDGMQLRTAYLPEVGQPVSCSFDVPELGNVLVSGVVIWQEKNGEGGEFGIRFTNIDPESAAHLKMLIARTHGDGIKTGARVRLHIDGLGSPLRARVRDAGSAQVTACSDLNFVQIGKGLDLEDATTGQKRPANIGKVQLEVDPETQIPQLVVSMRYADAEPEEIVDAGATDNTSEAAPEPSVDEGDEPVVQTKGATPEKAPPPIAAAEARDQEIEEESSKMKSAWAKKAQTVGPMLNAWAKGTKEKLSAMLQKRKDAPKDDVALPLRRMTSPPPAGALHASGRKVVRAEQLQDELEEPTKRGFKFTKRHAAVAGAVGIASILALVAFRKPAEKPLVSAPTTAETGAPDVPPGTPPNLAPGQASPTPAQNTAPGQLPVVSNQDMNIAPEDEKGQKGKKTKVVPFGNGPVAHGNVLRLKMDGSIEKIQGAQQPSGFTVVIPNRKSEEAAAPLAARDSRISGINVANNPTGAELTVSFKDGVPNYMVRARGNYLEIVLAQGMPSSDKDKDSEGPKSTAKKGHGPKHHKH